MTVRPDRPPPSTVETLREADSTTVQLGQNQAANPELVAGADPLLAEVASEGRAIIGRILLA